MVKEAFPDSDRLHANATVIDMHAHPIIKAHLFRRSLHRPVLTRSFLIGELYPLTVQNACNRLQTGGVDVLLSTPCPLEKRMFDDIKLMNVIPLKYARFHAMTKLKLEKKPKAFKVHSSPTLDDPLRQTTFTAKSRPNWI